MVYLAEAAMLRRALAVAPPPLLLLLCHAVGHEWLSVYLCIIQQRSVSLWGPHALLMIMYNTYLSEIYSSSWSRLSLRRARVCNCFEGKHLAAERGHKRLGLH
jgi:hypothetical protein